MLTLDDTANVDSRDYTTNMPETMQKPLQCRLVSSALLQIQQGNTNSSSTAVGPR
jgi:hypothetical protein